MQRNQLEAVSCCAEKQTEGNRNAAITAAQQKIYYGIVIPTDTTILAIPTLPIQADSFLDNDWTDKERGVEKY